MKRIIALLISILPFIPIYNADLSKVKFEYITVDDGLSQGVIENIFQDSQGYMWFATRDGLNRYDGIQFTIFRNDVKDPNSLASSFVTAVAEDMEGRIWIGSSGLNIYDPRLNRMTRIKVDQNNPDAYMGGRVYNIELDRDSTLWFSSVNGLIHYFPSKDRFKTYRPDPAVKGSIGNAAVNSVCITHDNKLYVATADDMIYEFDRATETFTGITYKTEYFGNNAVKYIQEDNQGSLYITSEFGAVHIYNPKTGVSRLLDKGNGQLNSTSIKTRVLIMGPEEVWIGTDGGGINIYNPVTGTMEYLVSDSRNANSLSGNAIFKIYMDKDKNVWVGHFGNGISVWKRNKEKFTSYVHNPFNPSSLNKEVVTAIFEDSRGRIWIGQDGGGLSLFNESTKSFEHIRHSENDPASLTSDVILTINEDPYGNLLLGTYSGGFMVFDCETRKVVKSFNTSNGLPSNHVWMIYRSSRDQYWVTFLAQGYGLYDPEKKSFELVDNTSPLACANIIMNVTEDKEGKIWFGSETEGVCILDWDNKSVKTYRHNEIDRNSLSYNDVKSIILQDKKVWIATNGGGLNCLDLATDSFKIYTIADGLSSNALMGILPDKSNNLWISSTRGLMKFDPSSGKTEIFDKTQGLQGSEFKYNALCLLRDGRMMFGGVNGVTVFFPDSIKSSKIVPSVVFTDFKIHNESVKVGVKGSPLGSHINFTDRLTLNHKQSVFTIEFASLDYNSSLKNRYMYKLEGFDENWIDAGNRRFVTYTNLDAGKYTFLLKGSNSDGVWNQTARTLVIRVRPPWYTTKLAIALYIIAIILGIIYYIKQREKQSVQDKLILEQKIQEAQAELKSKTRKVEEHEEVIRRRNEEEKDIRFYTDGVAKMSDIISKKRQNLEELSSAVISELVSYVGASAGGIFVVDDSDPLHVVIRASGNFCLSSDSSVNRVFEIGEGNIGACFKEKQTLTYDNLPDGYIVMRSGLGKISLHHAVYIPIIQDNLAVGVIEVASVEKLPGNNVIFMEKIAESLASIITIIKANDKSNQMIEQNNTQAEELMAQEEEMRQNMEELLATQEESQRREKKLESELEISEKTILDLKKQLSALKKKNA